MKRLFPFLLLLVATHAFAGNDQKTTAKKQAAKVKKQAQTVQQPQQTPTDDNKNEYGTRTFDARLARMLHVDSAGNIPLEDPMETVIGADGKERKEYKIMDERLIRSHYVSPALQNPVPAASINGKP